MIKLTNNLLIDPDKIIAIELRKTEEREYLIVHTENKNFIADVPVEEILGKLNNLQKGQHIVL